MRWIPALLLASATLLAAVPYSFRPGVPAKASQVNRNFEAIDSAVAAQFDQIAALRQVLLEKTEVLRQELAVLRAKAATLAIGGDSAKVVPASAPAKDSAARVLELPKGAVIGLLAAPGSDGFLPGSELTWQSLETYGPVDGMPLTVLSAPVPPTVPDTTGVARPAPDTANVSAPAAAAKPKLYWYVKVK